MPSLWASFLFLGQSRYWFRCLTLASARKTKGFVGTLTSVCRWVGHSRYSFLLEWSDLPALLPSCMGTIGVFFRT